MPRQARRKSSTGIYHALLRGIDKRDIFMDNDDKMRFLDNIEQAQEIANFTLHGFCLMSNHVHFLLEENSEEIGRSIKRVAVRYVGWHNNKYDRIGHLFQNRFKSEPVETEDSLYRVLRYIHQNPVKAGIVKAASEYPWSSYNNYIEAYSGRPSFVDTSKVMDLFKTATEFESYMSAQNDDETLEYNPEKKPSDITFKKVIGKKYGVACIAGLTRVERDKMIRQISAELDISIRQLSRVLDVGKSVVELALKKDDGKGQTG